MSARLIVLSLLFCSMLVAAFWLVGAQEPAAPGAAAAAVTTGAPGATEPAEVRAVGAPGPASPARGVASAPPPSSGQDRPGEAAGSPAAREPKASPPPTEDPEQLAIWFERRVEGELLRQKAGAAVGPGRQVDWAYLADVFAGRISGIPNERVAGVSLQEMDGLGNVPYVEQLRQEKRFDELRDLGFENETIPWPACLRTATCRIDRASSPPG